MGIVATTVCNALFLAMLLTFSHALLKWVSIQDAGSFLDIAYKYWWIIAVAIGVYVFIFFYYAFILRVTSISVLYPTYTGLSIVFVFVVGVFVFSEPVTGKQIFGCLLVLSGIYFVVGDSVK